MLAEDGLSLIVLSQGLNPTLVFRAGSRALLKKARCGRRLSSGWRPCSGRVRPSRGALPTAGVPLPSPPPQGEEARLRSGDGIGLHCNSPNELITFSAPPSAAEASPRKRKAPDAAPPAEAPADMPVLGGLQLRLIPEGQTANALIAAARALPRPPALIAAAAPRPVYAAASAEEALAPPAPPSRPIVLILCGIQARRRGPLPSPSGGPALRRPEEAAQPLPKRTTEGVYRPPHLPPPPRPPPPQGAGKSTFCARLPQPPWARVNQDTLGSREKCVGVLWTQARLHPPHTHSPTPTHPPTHLPTHQPYQPTPTRPCGAAPAGAPRGR